MHSSGVRKPPAGTEKKSRQAHSLRQQSAPTVVITTHEKPLLQRGSVAERVVSLSSQSESDEQSAEQSGPVFVTFSAAGWTQTCPGHSGTLGLMVALFGAVSARPPSPALRSQGAPTWIDGQPAT